MAALPYRVENRQLKAENLSWRQKQWRWTGVIVALLATAGALFLLMRRRHQREQARKAQQLEEMKQTLVQTEQQLGEATVNFGGLKGVVTSQTNALNRLKEEQQQAKEEHKEEIKRLKESIRSLEADIRQMKEEDRTLKRVESEQKQDLKELKRELKMQTDKLATVERQWEIDQRLNHFVMTSQDAVAVDLLMQLRYDNEKQTRFDIRSSEYLPLLKVLLAQEIPTLHEKLDNCGLERNKLTMCYLIALGLDDINMMARAAFLAPNSVKAYRKECREMVEALKSGSTT